MYRKVDFFIVGQPKSGTTALASFLDEHPDIAISIPKEVGYMSKDHIKESDSFHGQARYFHIRTPEQYSMVFEHAKPGQMIGEASTNYLYSKVAAKEIYRYNPRAKIIMVLRNPVDMIYSLYHQYRNETKENAKSFSEALNMENDRKKGDKLAKRAVTPSYHLYRQRGLYAEQVKRYLDIFDRKQLLIIPTESFRQDNAGYYKTVLEFLDVSNNTFSPAFKAVHESKIPRTGSLNRLVNAPALKNATLTILGQKNYTKIQKKVMEPLVLKKSARDKMPPHLRAELEAYFHNDVSRLSKLLKTDYSKLWQI